MSSKATYRKELYNGFNFDCSARFQEILDDIGKDMNWARKEMGYQSYNAGVHLKTQKDSRVSTVIRFCKVCGITPEDFFAGVDSNGNVSNRGPVLVSHSPGAVTTSGDSNHVHVQTGSKEQELLQLEVQHLKNVVELKDQIISSLKKQLELSCPP